jgi:hypothetical protein
VADKDYSFSSSLSVAEIARKFQEVVDSKAYLGALQKMAIRGGARFDWSEPDSGSAGMFDQFDDDRPAFSAVKSLIGTSGFLAWAVHIYIYDREDRRDVLLSARGTLTDRRPAVRAVEMFIQEIRQLDSRVEVH